MINRVTLVGRIAKPFDLRYTNNQKAVTQFTVAVNRQFKSGEQEADFVNCVAWNKTAENMAQYVGKGSLIGVDGRIQTRSYDDATGKKVFVTEVVADSVQFLEPKKESNHGYQQVQAQTGSSQFDKSFEITDDMLPF